VAVPPASMPERHRARHPPNRLLIARPSAGQLATMRAWLDENFGPAAWTSAPAGLGGIVNDAVAFYFIEDADARAFVDRFCCGYRV
jgi:hypothetical protein